MSAGTSSWEAIRKMARFLKFFADSRNYKIIDILAMPFSYDDVVRAVNEALRQARVAVSSAYEKEVEVEGKKIKIKVVKVGTDEVLAPRIPDEATVNVFLDLCKKDLVHAREAATLALAYTTPHKVSGGE